MGSGKEEILSSNSGSLGSMLASLASMWAPHCGFHHVVHLFILRSFYQTGGLPFSQPHPTPEIEHYLTRCLGMNSGFASF